MKHSGNVAFFLCLVIVSYLTFKHFDSSSARKIGVVQMDHLVYEYKGMKEASNLYSKKVTEWDRQADSLQTRLSSLYEQIRLDSIRKDRSGLDRDVKMFVLYKKSYLEYVESIKLNAAQKDKEMTLGVVNQLKEYIKTYAKENGYDVILCNSEQQSIGHVEEKVDVTTEVLAYANNKYDGLH